MTAPPTIPCPPGWALVSMPAGALFGFGGRGRWLEAQADGTWRGSDGGPELRGRSASQAQAVEDAAAALAEREEGR